MTDHQMLDAQMERAAREHPAAYLWGDGAVVSTCMLRGVPDGGERHESLEHPAAHVEHCRSIEQRRRRGQGRARGGGRRRRRCTAPTATAPIAPTAPTATSALDSETEHDVMQSIEALGDDITLLIIAHRLTTLKNCTQIVELAGGGIKRAGSYEDIVNRSKTTMQLNR